MSSQSFRRAFLCLAALLSLLCFAGDSLQDKYITKYKALAVSEMHRSGVPASITLAQGMLESSCGTSTLAREANNHFGIKCHNSWTGERVYHDDDAKGECFRKYRTVDESYMDHSDFIRYRQRYSALFDLEITDYKGWANGLGQCGYATDPRYPQKLIDLIETYKLYKFDSEQAQGAGSESADSLAIPVSPGTLAAPETASYDASYGFAADHKVYNMNGVAFVYSYPEDTYESIATNNNLFVKELLRFNDLKTEPEYLAPGTIVYLQAKKSQAQKGQEKHIIDFDQDGTNVENALYFISQKYAIKMSALLKLNYIKDPASVVDGQEIVLRKEARVKRDRQSVNE